MEHAVTEYAQYAPSKKGRRSKRDGNSEDGKKRRCISSACVPCRKRKSKVRNADPASCLSPAQTRSSPEHQWRTRGACL
jgi:hypothetical protein